VNAFGTFTFQSVVVPVLIVNVPTLAYPKRGARFICNAYVEVVFIPVNVIVMGPLFP